MKALRTFVYNVLCLMSGSQKIKDFKTPCPALFVTKTRQHHFQDDAQLGRIVDCWTAIHLDALYNPSFISSQLKPPRICRRVSAPGINVIPILSFRDIAKINGFRFGCRRYTLIKLTLYINNSLDLCRSPAEILVEKSTKNLNESTCLCILSVGKFFMYERIYQG